MAVTIDAAALALQLATDETTAERLLGVAGVLVLRYCPDAPDGCHNEAVVRVAGYMHGAPPAMAAHRELHAGGDAVQFEMRNPAVSAVRMSGAAALLSPWRVRRAVRAEVAS